MHPLTQYLDPLLVAALLGLRSLLTVELLILEPLLVADLFDLLSLLTVKLLTQAPLIAASLEGCSSLPYCRVVWPRSVSRKTNPSKANPSKSKLIQAKQNLGEKPIVRLGQKLL